MADKSTAAIPANLGLYLGMPPIQVPKRALIACMNVRVKQGKLDKSQMGWAPFHDINLDGKPVLLIDLFEPRSGDRQAVFGNTTDLFSYDPSTELVAYLTPRYVTGSVDVINGNALIAGNGTAWLANVKAGDFISVGAADETDPAATWYEIGTVNSDTEILLPAGPGYAGANDTTVPYTIRQTFQGNLRHPWVTETFLDAADVAGTDGDRWYATNGIDQVVAWDGIADQVYVPNLGNVEAAAWIKRFKNCMVYVAPTLSSDFRGFAVRTSAIGAPENTTTLEAAEFIVHDGAEALVCAHMLGEQLVLYSRNSGGTGRVTSMQFIGFPGLGFAFRTAFVGDAPVSAFAIAPFADHHEFIGTDGQYAFDGGRAIPINTHIWRDITRQASRSRFDMIRNHFDESHGELNWVVPLNTDNTGADGPPVHAFPAYYLEDVGDLPTPHTRRELPATAFGYYKRDAVVTWDEMTESWDEYNMRWSDSVLQKDYPLSLFGTATGDIFILNGAESQNGVTPDWFARFARRPLGDVRYKGIVRRIYPFVNRKNGATHSIQVRLRIASTLDGPSAEVIELPYLMDAADARDFVTPRVPGRYLEVEFGADGEKGQCELSGYDVDTVRTGSR